MDINADEVQAAQVMFDRTYGTALSRAARASR